MSAVFAPRGPWLFGRSTDLWAFGGSAALAFALLAWGAAVGLLEADTPDWLWLAAVLAVDVAHVWSTLFRVYLDGTEVRRRPLLYLGAPVLLYGAGVLLHAFGSGVFWSALAYLAVFHFVRQQVGWVRLYHRREPRVGPADRLLDEVTTYAATLWPLLWWHGHLPRRFHWMLDGDFLGGRFTAWAHAVAAWTEPLYWALLGGFLLRQLARLRGDRPAPGKVLVVLTTWACWYVGIVALDGDFAFTVTNVLIHGVPYLVLTYRYGRARAADEPNAHTLRRLMARGIPAFLVTVILLAALEETLWDRYVWHDHPGVFGAGGAVEGLALALLVPLLALPQLTHYLLDGFVWRRSGMPPRG
ncbi:MAG: hypothetical protein CMN30_13070 [Sandaracinus sp.]|nr:hypothetical protein [Sandaracinus sp.]